MKSYPQHYSKGDFLFFLHIPKTAGTSFTKTLQSGFSEENTIQPQQMNAARKHPREIFERAELLCGHFTLLMCQRRLPNQPDIVLTFLRNPVEHFVSLFFHLKIDPTFSYTIRLTKDKAEAQALHEKLQAASIEDFLAMPESSQFDNFQTRYLINGLCHQHSDLSDEEKLPIAQSALATLPFFGLTERYEESLKLLNEMMGNALQPKAAKINRSRNKPRDYSLADETLKEINVRTAIDQKLLAVAEQLFAARLGALT